MSEMTAKVAVISMGPHADQGMWTAYAHGHPRIDAIELLRAGIARRTRNEQVHIASARKTFHQETMRHAIYATGWDGAVVIFARSDGRLVVRTEH